MNSINQVLRFTKALEIAASAIAGLAIFLIMVIVCVDVARRYIFNSPLVWSYDFIQLYLMGVSFFFALSDTLRRRHHVNVDILFNRFSTRTQLFWNAVGWTLSAALFVTILVVIGRTAYDDWAAGNVIDGAVPWPTWITSAIATVGVLLICMRLALGALAYIVAVITDASGDEVEAMEQADTNELEV